MQNLTINNIPVLFPFKPYDLQVDMMSNIISAISKGENCLLESPTGTGKTICLLSSTLAFVKANTDKKLRLRIYFASRTHSQLSQVIKELKRSAYSDVKVTVLGSRDQMCINDSIKNSAKGTALSSLCRKKVTQRSCSFNEMVDVTKTNPKFHSQIMDIEDIVAFGKEVRTCPYFLSRDGQSTSEIIFLPYNYLTDPNSRRSQNIDVTNSIIIFDEGHNLEGSCADSTSFEISTEDIEKCITEVQRCFEIAQKTCQKDWMQNFSVLKDVLVKFISELRSIKLNRSNDISYPGEYIVKLFEKVNVNVNSIEGLYQVIDMAVDFLVTDKKSTKFHIQIFLSCVKQAFKFGSDVTPESEIFWRAHKVHISSSTVPARQSSHYQQKKPSLPNIIVGFWCFNSGVAMNGLIADGARSIIIASGTLAPLESFTTEMGIRFNYKLENPHVISKSQILIGVLKTGPQACKLNSNYENRNNSNYLKDLGNVCLNVCRVSPDGLLVFFSSYGQMEVCITNWKSKSSGNEKSIWERIGALKDVIVEPKNKDEFAKSIQDYYRKIALKELKGAAFFAVCRGKASEGIDFSDSKGRTVIICGIPYPSSKDPKVLLKKKFLEDSKYENLKNGVTGISGEEWYRQQASRAVNQAIGRVIRHRDDFGAILLCDERFSGKNALGDLPKWLSPNVESFANFGSMYSRLSSFFKKMKSLEIPSKILEQVQLLQPQIIQRNNSQVFLGGISQQTESILDPVDKIFKAKESRKFASSSSSTANDLAVPLANPFSSKYIPSPKRNLIPTSKEKFKFTYTANGQLKRLLPSPVKIAYESDEKKGKIELAKKFDLKNGEVNKVKEVGCNSIVDKRSVLGDVSIVVNSSTTPRKKVLGGKDKTPMKQSLITNAGSVKKSLKTSTFDKPADKKKYLTKVRASLEPNSFKEFQTILQSYSLSKDKNWLIDQIKSFFLKLPCSFEERKELFYEFGMCCLGAKSVTFERFESHLISFI